MVLLHYWLPAQSWCSHHRPPTPQWFPRTISRPPSHGFYAPSAPPTQGWFSRTVAPLRCLSTAARSPACSFGTPRHACLPAVSEHHLPAHGGVGTLPRDHLPAVSEHHATFAYPQYLNTISPSSTAVSEHRRTITCLQCQNTMPYLPTHSI